MVLSKNSLPFLSAILYAVAFYLLYSCATPSRPNGGPRDKQAPQLHAKRYSTPNKSVNFKQREIILSFDEWVKLNNIYGQMIVSPPLEEKPLVTVKYKSVLFRFKETLKDSTTYTIHFGDAIQDNNEGNALKDYKFIFSTGAELDSLEVEGKVKNALTEQAEADVLVMLYRGVADSLPLNQKPYYFAKTDEQGRFKMNYLRSGRYKVFALRDQNVNYLYDLPNEEIAFLDSLIVLEDTLKANLNLELFQEELDFKLKQKKSKHFGDLSLLWNKKVKGVSVRLLDPPNNYQEQITYDRDSVHVWFDGDFTASKLAWEINYPKENYTDTISVIIDSRDSLESYGLRAGYQNNTIASKQMAVVEFNYPIAQLAVEKIALYRDSQLLVLDTVVLENTDSLGVITLDTIIRSTKVDTFLQTVDFNWQRDSSSTRRIYIEATWEKGRKYSLHLLPNAVESTFGILNRDTIYLVLDIGQKTDYASIKVNLNGLEEGQQYLLQLLQDQKEEEVIIEERVFEDTAGIIRFEHLAPGSYRLRIVEDRDRNYQWTPGNYSTKQQAEFVFNPKEVQLKADWEAEVDINLKELEGVLEDK